MTELVNSQHILRLIVLALILLCATSQRISDFTYAEYTMTEYQSKKNKIQIHPQRSILDLYEFPQACKFDHLLEEIGSTDDTSLQLSNVDSEIEFFKDKSARFLELTEKLQNSRKHLQNLPTFKNDKGLIVQKEEMQKVENIEQRLKDIHDLVKEKNEDLQRLVLEATKKEQNPIFKEATLKFQKSALQRKLTLLDQLLEESDQRKKDSLDAHPGITDVPQHMINDYFRDLDIIFRGEYDLVNEIDSLLQNHAELSIIKQKINNLRSQLKVHDLEIVQKQQCRNEFDRIRQKQKHDRQIIELIETLKQKKNNFNELTEANKYCEGVVAKLTNRIKKIMKSYNYVYICAEGLEQTKKARDDIARQLADLQAKLNEIQKSQAVKGFQIKFESNKKSVQQKLKDIDSIQLNNYHNNPIEIQNIIRQTKFQIQAIDEELQRIPYQKNSASRVSQQDINRLIKQLKELKTQYCKLSKQHNQVSKTIDDKIHGLRQQSEYNTWLRKLAMEKLAQIEAMKLEMENLQLQIQKHIDNE